VVAEKIALCAIVGVALGFLLALGFGAAAEISSSGAAWARIPLLLVPLAAAGAAFGALGCVVGAAARDLRASSLVGVALVTPIVLVGLVPRTVSPLAATVSEFLPFAPSARAFGATLFAAQPLADALAASGHLLLLTAALAAVALALFSRLTRS
jgi:ABC-type polysaccharide/polyol phosphate export permease